MKRFVKFGAILMALAVAFVSCRGGNGGGQKTVSEMTVNAGITDGTTELKAPVAIKGADFNAIKAKLVAELGLGEVGGNYEFEKDGTTYTVNIVGFFSNKEANAIIGDNEIKTGDTIYVIATVSAITVNVGITDGNELKAPVAIKGVDFNAIKAKFVEKFDLTALGSEYLFIDASQNIYTVDLGAFFSDVATATQVQAADVKAGNTIYLKATAKTVNVTFAITDGTTKLNETIVGISKLDFAAVASTVAGQLGINIFGMTVTINGDTYTVDTNKLYSDVNATKEVNQDNAVEVVASGATIYLKATKN